MRGIGSAYSQFYGWIYSSAYFFVSSSSSRPRWAPQLWQVYFGQRPLGSGGGSGFARRGRNPFRVVSARGFKPRVARSLQPWAGGRNPFVIATWRSLFLRRSTFEIRGLDAAGIFAVEGAIQAAAPEESFGF